MFSGDNMGLIIVWKTSVNDSRQQQQPCRHWCIERVQELILFTALYLANVSLWSF